MLAISLLTSAAFSLLRLRFELWQNKRAKKTVDAFLAPNRIQPRVNKIAFKLAALEEGLSKTAELNENSEWKKVFSTYAEVTRDIQLDIAQTLDDLKNVRILPIIDEEPESSDDEEPENEEIKNG